MSKTIVISSKCPRSLKRRYQRLKSAHRVAEELGVNVSHVYDALTQGKEPANREIAIKLGFNVMRFGDHRTRHMRAWDRLSGQQKHKIIFDWFHHAYDDKKE